jgi:hypothetical protein
MGLKRGGRNDHFVLMMFALLLAVLLPVGCSRDDSGSRPAGEYAAEGGLGNYPGLLLGHELGLWAETVETIPDDPAALPPSFWEEPEGTVASYPAGFANVVSFRSLAEVEKPLWLFAEHLEKQRLDELVKQAVDEGRVVVVYARRWEDLVGYAAPPASQGPHAAYGWVLSWVPWDPAGPRENSPYFLNPPDLDLPSRDAVYAAMAFETLAGEKRPGGG